MRTIVFGDTGGHADPLLASLQAIGMDMNTLKLPDNIRVVHLGDLIHKGPFSNEIIMIINFILARNPEQWIQILGNHEFNYVDGAPHFWFNDLNNHSIHILHSWIEKGLARPAFALPGGNHIISTSEVNHTSSILDKGILFTHAGLTRQFWKNINHEPNALRAAEMINNLSVKEVTKPGIMLETMFAGLNPGPVWALASTEVYQSWEMDPQIEMPFIQVHGHTVAYEWFLNEWYSTVSPNFKRNTILDYTNRLSFTSLAGSLLIGCDPGFSETFDMKQQPFLTLDDNII